MRRTTGIAILTALLVALACTGMVVYHEQRTGALLDESRQLHQALADLASSGISHDLARREEAAVALLESVSTEPDEVAEQRLRTFRPTALHSMGARLFRGDGRIAASDGIVDVSFEMVSRGSSHAISYLEPSVAGRPLTLVARRTSPSGERFVLVATYDLRELFADGIGTYGRIPGHPQVHVFDRDGRLVFDSLRHGDSQPAPDPARIKNGDMPTEVGSVSAVVRENLTFTVVVTSKRREVVGQFRRDMVVAGIASLILLLALTVPFYFQRKVETEAFRARREAREWQSALADQKVAARSDREAAAIIEAAHDAIWVVSPAGSIEYMNPAAEAFFGPGVTNIEAMRSRVFEDDRAHTREALEVARAGKPSQFELRVAGDTQPWHVAEVNVVPMATEGVVERIVFSARDVTDERLHATHVHDAQSRFRRLLDGARVAAIFLDAEGKVDFANAHLLEITGYATQELVGQQWINFIAPEMKDEYKRDYLDRVQSGDFEPTAEYDVITRTGERRTISWKRVVLRNVAGQPTGVGSIGEDLTAIRQAAEAMRRVRDFYGKILDTIVSGVFVTDEHDQVTYSNVSIRTRSKLPLDDLVTFRSREDVPNSCVPLYEYYSAARKSLEPVQFSNVAIHLPAGGTRLHSGWMIPLVENEKFNGMICTSEDVTERAWTEAALEQSLSEYGTLISSVPGIVWKADAQTFQFHYVSPEAERILGYPADDWYQPNFWIDHVHEEDRTWAANFCLAATNELRSHTFEYRMIAADGRVVWFRDVVSVTGESGRPVTLFGVLVDITDRKVAEDALRESEARFRAIYEQSELGIVLYGKEGVHECNSAFKRMVGVGAENLTRGACLAPFPGLKDQLERVFGGHTDADQAEFTLRRADGLPPFGVRSVASIVRDAAGAPIVAVAIIEDVTARREAERELGESREKFRKLVELTSDWFWEIDAEANYTYVSPRVFNVLGYRPDEVLGRKLPVHLHPNEQARFQSIFDSVKEARQSFSLLEVEFLHRDGKRVLVETSGTPIFSRDGEVTGFHGIARDITEREENRAERLRLATAIESAAEAIFITNLDGVIEYVNPAFEVITGYTREEVVGQNARLLNSGRQNADVYDGLWKTIGRGRVWVGHFVNRRKDGTLYEADATIAPIYAEPNLPSGYVAVQRDVTEHMQLVARLQQAQEFERLGRIVSGVAHEVRNPLNAIRAASAALELDFGHDEGAKPLFDVVTAQVDRLARLMRELLELGKPLDAARLEGRKVDELIHEAIELWRGTHPAESAERISVTVDSDLPRVRVDANRIQQVLINLLDNAMQHSPAGEPIKVDAALDAGQVRISVQDRGRGLAPEHAAKLFEPFFTTRRGGTGLGLSLVKNIVQQHGGHSVLRNNTDGAGCIAEVFLPPMHVEEFASVVS